jgi:hypothetical protein
MNTTYHSDLIENYLQGRLSSEEKIAFEKELQSNSSLQEEVSFQKNLLVGIQSYRKQELKERLNRITIPSSPMVQIPTYVKVAAIILLTGIGSYLTIQSLHQSTEESSTKNNQSVKLNTLPATSLKNNTASSEEKPVSRITAKSNTQSKPITKKESYSKNTITKEEHSTPIAATLPDEPKEEHINYQDNNSTPLINEISNKPSIEVIINKEGTTSNELAYQYYDGKLYLYGNLEKEAYELLEFNNLSGKQLYLFYQHHYYHLAPTQYERTILKKVVQGKLIKELDIHRKSIN